jgi:chromosome segregation ATPase
LSSTFRKLGQSELLPRYIFAESLYARRRVLEIGAVASTLGQSARFLATRGARIVVAADADVSAVQEAQSKLAGPNLRFRATVFDDLDAGSFDLVIVADLAPYVRAPELLKDLVRLVAKNGYLMGGLRNPAGLALANVMDPEGAEPPPTYGQLLDSLSVHFRSIEVATQSPVLGYQLAFEKGEGLQVDGSLAGASEAAYYVVLAGHEPVRFFDPTWVQLPPEPLAFTGGKLEDASNRARNWQERSDRLKDALGKSRDEVTRKETELKDIRTELEGSREAIARLTAQIESISARPKDTRAADELTQKVRRIEAELVVAKERAVDAENRVGAMRQEVDLHKSEQKNATVETLAAQENARLERTRREQVASELDDARTRLTAAYEDLRRVQDDAAAQRVEAERARLNADRIAEQLAAKDRELDSAREKELRLAQARSESLSAIEGLQHDFKRAQTAQAAAEEAGRMKEAEATAAIRSLDLETQRNASATRELENLRAKSKELADDLDERTAALTGAETELQAAKAAGARLQRDIETLASSERTWRETAQAYETRLNDTLANVESLSEQVARLDAEKEAETARFNRLERDSSTAIGAERSAREQAQALLADTQTKLQEVSDDRERLLEQRDELTASVGDLQKIRASGENAQADQRARIAVLEADLNAAQVRVAALEKELEETKAQLAQTRQEREQLWTEKGGLEKDLEETKGQLSQTQAEREQLRTQGEELRTEKTGLEKNLEQTQAQLAETRTDREKAWNEKNALELRVQELEQLSVETADRLSEREAVNARLNEQIAEAQDEVDRAHGDVSTQLAAAETKARELARERDAARAEAARLSGQLDQGRQRVAELAQRSARLETESKDLRARISEVEAQSRDRQERLQETQVKFTHAARAAADAEAKVRADLAAREAELEEAKRAAEEERTRLAEQIATGEKAQKEAFGRAVDRERDLETVRESLKATEAARLKLEQVLEADRKDAAERRTELEGNLTQAREQITRLESRGEVLGGESKVLQHELDVQLAKVKELEQQKADAVAEAERVLFEAKEKAQRELGEARDAAEQQLAATEGTAQQRVSVLTQEIEAYKADRLELEGRLTTAQQHSEHLDAELAEATEGRASEAQLREKTEAQRDALKAELEAARADTAKANEWVVGGKTENEKLVGDLKSARADAERTQEELNGQRKVTETTQGELNATREQVQAMQRAAEEKERERIDLSDALSREKAELSVTKQQLDASKADVGRGEEDLKKLRGELGDLEKRFEEQLKTQRDDLEARAIAQQREAIAANEQLDSLKKELQLVRSGVDKAQSEARGHQAGKLQLQKELDGARGELSEARASLAALGGETQAMAESRAQDRAEAQALQQRAQEAEGRAAKAEGKVSELESFIALAEEQKKGLEAEVASAKGAATGSASELDGALAGRKQAEELLIKLRARYAELELQVQTEIPALREQLSEAHGDNQMMDAERERLASQVERLEATRTQGADAEKELKNRIDMLQRRVNAQDAELGALRRRASTGQTQAGLKAIVPAPAAAAPPPPKPSAPPPVVRGTPLDEPETPTLKQQQTAKPAPPASTIGRQALGTGVHTAITPVMSPAIKDAKPPQPPAKSPPSPDKTEDFELEVFELEEDSKNGDDEELLLLDEEAEPTQGGNGNGGKK